MFFPWEPQDVKKGKSWYDPASPVLPKKGPHFEKL